MLRVLSVHDAREWLLPLPRGAQEIRVADVKRLVREQQQQAAAAAGASHDDAAESASDTFVVFRGRFLADVDVVDLNALTAADFLVLAHESPPPTDDSDGADDDTQEQNELEQQLAVMGFDPVRVRAAVRRSGGDLATAIALLTGDAEVPLMVAARANVARRHTRRLRVLQPALDELEALQMRQAAAADGFGAVMRLKQFAPTAALEQLNAHPAAAVAFWRLPLERAGGALDAEPPAEPLAAVAAAAAGGEEDADVVDRLASMGFERDLAAAVYESCGRREEAALNALCEMLQ